MMSKDHGTLFGSVFSIWWTLRRWVLVGSCAVAVCTGLMPAQAAEAVKSGISMAFDRLPIQQLVMMWYEECDKRGVVFDSAVNKLEEVITAKVPALACSQARALLLDALARAGVGIESRGSYDLIRPLTAKDERDGWREVIYMPRHRDAIELAEQAQILVRKGQFAHQRRAAQIQVASGSEQVAEAGANGASITAKAVDKLVFFGPEAESKAVEGLLARLDVPSPQVEIRAGIYEYQRGKSEGSAVNAAMTLVKAHLGVTFAGATTQAGGALKLNLPHVETVLSLLDADSRFRYVARPKVIVKDGELVRFFAGEDVRVVGSVVLDRNGNAVQSRETLSAGVTLEATPRVRGDVVDLSLYQAVSNFVAGAGDPSVLKRDLRSRLVMELGTVYVIGGLHAIRKTQSHQRFLGLSIGRSDDDAETEVLLLLCVLRDDTAS